MQGDRNTLLLILLVFLVTLVTFGVVIYLSWQFAGDSISLFVDKVAEFIEIQSLDYNFELPEES